MPEADGFDFEKLARQIAKGAVTGVLESLKNWWNGDGAPTESGRGILVIGSNGVGKTTLARLLSGRGTLLDADLGDYDESFRVESFPLADDPGTELLVAPGQPFRREVNWPELKSQLAAGVYRAWCW